MKVQTYGCDYCSTQKAESNHWFVRCPSDQGFLLYRWDKVAQEEIDAPGNEHICSESCASKALSRWLTQASGNEIRKEATE